MTKNFWLTFALCLVIGVSFTSCGDDDPVIDTPEELITTLRYTLTPDDGGSALVLSFQDIDGEGGDAPVVTSGQLAANTTYSGSLTLLNESVDPVEDITLEIQEEDEEHQFFFASTVAGLTVAYDDMDADGNPIGLASKLTTGETGSGTLTVTLLHEPTKDATGVAEGDLSNADGETDIEVSFDITVE